MLPQNCSENCVETPEKNTNFLSSAFDEESKDSPKEESDCDISKKASVDFSSHFLIRKTLENNPMNIDSNTSLTKIENSKDLPNASVSPNVSKIPSLLSLSKDAVSNSVVPQKPFPCSFPVLNKLTIPKDISQDKINASTPSQTQILGACALVETKSSSALLPPNSQVKHKGFHPFMTSRPSVVLKNDNKVGTKLQDFPESPMDRSYHSVSKFCMKPVVRERRFVHDDEFVAYQEVLDSCCQISPIPIQSIFNGLTNLEKIGEGVYGEVYSGSFRYFGQSNWVYKIVAIEGHAMVNGERQKTFEEVLPEIIVSQELSKLRYGLNQSYTDGYVLMRNARVAKGIYPRELVHCWEGFHEKYESDNDRPEFPPEQLYMVLEFEFAGQDIESFQFTDARQTLSIVLQVAHILAVGEAALEFEHRDLHWGNIMVETWEPPYTKYLIKGQTMYVPCIGIKVVVIDFTISRIKDSDKTVYLDLKDDEEQFLGNGDHQFDIYRMMRDHNRNNWETFCPKSNIFWLHYLADKLFIKGKYTEPHSAWHIKAIRKLREFSQLIFEHDSAVKFVQSQHCNSYKEFIKCISVQK